MRPLFPSLTEIEHGLFRPSDELLSRIAAKEREVPEDLRQAVASDDESAGIVAELRAAARIGDVDERSTLPESAAQVSPHIADMIRRRVASSGHSFSRVPTPGQILSIEHVVGPDGNLGWDVARPLAVLIESPSVREDGSEFPDVWYGWMVAPETDYATWWDFVLGAEDEPFDPLVGVVQVWNPVYVYLKSTSRVLAELRPARLQAVRALAEEYVTAAEPDPGEARPGFVAQRMTLGGLPVLTGTPLSGPDDPRWHYQELYHEAAEAIRLPARLAQEQRLDWLVTADVRQLSVDRFEFVSLFEPDRVIELRFIRRPSSKEAAVLVQLLRGRRADAPVLVGDVEIQFKGGVAGVSGDLARKIATLAKLPDVYGNWPDTIKQLARWSGFTSPQVRSLLGQLSEAARRIGESASQVVTLLLDASAPLRPAMRPATRQPVPETAVPVVVGLSRLDAREFEVRLAWSGEPPTVIDYVCLQLPGSKAEPCRAFRWSHKYVEIRLTDIPLDESMSAAAALSMGVLTLSFQRT